MTNTEKLFLNRQKMDLFSEWIAEGDVYVQIDARTDDVILPESHRDDPMLTLKMSNAFNYIPKIDKDGIKVNLRFSGNYFDCEIPWEKVWGIRTESGQNKIWKEDIPKEVAIKMAKEVLTNIGSKLLQKVKPEKVETEKLEGTKTGEEQAKPAKKKPNLKLVK